jgi:hypothetical protein
MRRPLIAASAPVLLIALAVVGARLAGAGRGAAGTDAAEEDAAAARAARPLVGAELDRMRRDLDAKNAGAATRSAEGFVRADLLPPAAAQEAALGDIAVSRLRPHRYRVRGHAAWTDAAGTPQRRRFEADLLHGPADDRWRLVDTEFLP